MLWTLGFGSWLDTGCWVLGLVLWALVWYWVLDSVSWALAPGIWIFVGTGLLVSGSYALCIGFGSWLITGHWGLVEHWASSIGSCTVGGSLDLG